MKRKYIDAVDLTALGEGEMVALASTFGNVDMHGDRVIRGAYSTDVAKVKAGATLPLVWGHDVNGSPQNFVGEIYDADETSEGLEVRARFDLDDPVARKAYRLVKRGAIDKLSIGYRVRRERRAKDGITELLDIELHEVSLVLSPANDRARVLTIKDAATAAVPSDAELRAQAKSLGIEPPPSRRELRRHSNKVALEAAQGFEPLPKPEPAPANPGPTVRELRKHSRQVQLDAALGWEMLPQPSKPGTKGPTEAQLRRQSAELGIPTGRRRTELNLLHDDYDSVKERARNDMLALFAAADRQAGAA